MVHIISMDNFSEFYQHINIGKMTFGAETLIFVALTILGGSGSLSEISPPHSFGLYFTISF